MSAAPKQAEIDVPEVCWDLAAQKSVQAAKAKCGTAVEPNKRWTVPPAVPHPGLKSY